MSKLTLGMFVLTLSVSVWIFAAWAISSVVTSAIKAFNNSCYYTYQVEDLGVKGSLFCPKEGQ